MKSAAPAASPAAQAARPLGTQVFWNSGALLFGSVANKLLRLGAALFLARYLGATGFGRLALVFAFAEIFRLICDLGLDVVAVRQLARVPSQADRLIPATILLKAGLSVLAILAAGGTALACGYSETLVLLISLATLASAFQSLASGFGALFRARLEVSRFLPVLLAEGAVFFALVVCGTLTRQGLPFFVGVFSVAACLAAVLAFRLARRITSFNWNFDRSLVWDLLRQAWPLTVSLIFGAIYFRIDTILVNALAGDRATGLYSACFKLTETFLLVPSAVAASLLPVLSLLRRENPARMIAAFRKTYQLLLALGIFASGLLAFAAAPLVKAAYGAEFGEAAGGLAVLAWSLTFMFVNMLWTQALLAYDCQKKLAWVTLGNVLVNVGANLVLIPIAGFRGACIATVLTEAVSFVLQGVIIRRLAGSLGILKATAQGAALAAGAVALETAARSLSSGWLVTGIAVWSGLMLAFLFSLRGVLGRLPLFPFFRSPAQETVFPEVPWS